MDTKKDLKNSLIQKGDLDWIRPTLILFGRFFGIVVFPALFGTLLGIFLDKKYNTEPWLLLFSVGIIFLFSIAMLIKNTFKEFKKLENLKENDAFRTKQFKK